MHTALWVSRSKISTLARTGILYMGGPSTRPGSASSPSSDGTNSFSMAIRMQSTGN